MPELHVIEVMGLLLLGLLAGAVGGLVGVGGSIVIIPFLTILMHHADTDGPEGRYQQLSQAAAMIVNVFVAVPAVIQHHRAGAVQWGVFTRMLPAGLVLIVAGVEASNHLDGKHLMKLYGVFLVYVVVSNAARLRGDSGDAEVLGPRRTGWGRLSVIGGSMGALAGLLGIGGGPVSTPLLQRLCGLPLRQAIATTTAVMCLTAAVGAARKNTTLEGLTDAAGQSLGLRLEDSLLIALCLVPTAVIGALAGAGLTHTLPVRWVRLAFILLMTWASAKMLGLF